VQLNDYYGYSPTSGGDFYGDDGLGLGAGWQSHGASEAGDPHLHSLAEVTGYHIHALDGDIGHLEDFLVDDETWKIEYAVIDTKNWGFGHHVLVSPAEIKAIDWRERYLRINLTCYRIKCSPFWQKPS
jgi:hypothetical protein